MEPERHGRLRTAQSQGGEQGDMSNRANWLRGLAVVAVVCVIAACAVANENTAPRTWEQIAAEECGLGTEAVAQLKRDRVLVSNQAYKQVFTPYIETNVPVFITSDSLLNAYHVLYEESILALEKANARKLPSILAGLNRGLDDASASFSGLPPELVAGAKKRLQIVLGTALTLAGGAVKPDNGIADIVRQEVARVLAANAVMKPDWLGPPDPTFLALDYSRYQPRGFYNRTPALRDYFRAVSWLQSIPFRLARDDEFLAMLMLRASIEKFPWEEQQQAIRLFGCYARLLGKPDDWTFVDSRSGWGDPGVSGLGELKRLRDGFIDRARAGRSAQVNDQVALPSDATAAGTEPSFRISSAYRTPDAVLFQRTTDIRAFERPFPAGPEVCAALGSSFAAGQLEYSDKPRLLATIAACKPLFAGDSLYHLYLECVAALLDAPEPDAPAFMSSVAWQRKSCNAVLAGWAQLRHTWALQAKQTASYTCGFELPPGFVEPEPEFFARLANLAAQTTSVLKEHGPFPADYKWMAEDMRFTIKTLKEYDPDNPASKWHEVPARPALKSAKAMRFDAKDKWAATGPDEKEQEPPRGGWDFLRFCSMLGSDRMNEEEKARISNAIEIAGLTDLQFDDFRTLLEGLDALARRIEAGKEAEDPELLRALRSRLPSDLLTLWGRLEALSRRLEALAHKQLRGRPFNRADNELLEGYGDALAGIMLYSGNSYVTPRDDAPRIVDVHSNPVLGRYLEVGIGRARALYVLYPFNGQDVLCRGAVMPYHEFTSPTRLTDAEWKTTLDGADSPALPDWLQPIATPGKAVLVAPR